MLTTYVSRIVFLVIGICCIINHVYAESMLVKKQKFTTENFKTMSGDVLPVVNVGWESYGKLNSKRDNVILITHYFSGTSHAAGKYNANDVKAGYWDAIIGPGKAIDTNRYYVISSDTLVNANAKDPNVITTGPATVNPKTKRPYGLDFPVVTIRDFVNVQHALLKSLGISKLHAVVGASMGSHQALEWATAYPDMIPRVISVIGLGATDSYGVAALENWVMPIKQDPHWNNGNYYGHEEPTTGLVNSFKVITLTAQHANILDRRFAEKQRVDDGPKQSILNDFAVNSWIDEYARSRAKMSDANHILYLARACQLFTIGQNGSLAKGIAPIKAKILFLPAKNDLLLPSYTTRSVYEMLKSQGKEVKYEEIEGPWGHLDGIFSIGQKSKTIADFLSS
jgi:homoserine O-acetyltransferase